MTLNRSAVNDAYVQGSNEIELSHVRGDNPNSRGKCESALSARMIAIAAIFVLILSILVSTIAVVVYHRTITKTHEDASTRRFDLLELHQGTLEYNQVKTDRHLDTVAEKQNNSGKQVAFCVFALHPTLSDGKIPTFYNTVFNTGSYNALNGKFTCPVAGLYYFNFSFEHNNLDNGVALCYFHVNDFGNVYLRLPVPNEVASGSVIHHLSVNDTVNLYCDRNWEAVLTRHWNAIFSGFLISQD